jgi:predicted DNA-binding transcriptional regulator YafY
MSRDKPVLRAIKLLSLIERNANGLRVTDMAEQLGAPPRAVYRDLDVLQQLEVPLYTDKNGKESYWKIDPDFRNRLSIPFTLSELLSLYFAQDSIRPLDGTVLYDSLQSLFEKVWANLPKPLFKEMIGLRGSFLSRIPAQAAPESLARARVDRERGFVQPDRRRHGGSVPRRNRHLRQIAPEGP